MDEGSVRIKRAENGFEVCMIDPEVRKKNMESDGRYEDPEKRYVFKTRDEVMEFLQENMDKLMPDMDDGMGKEFDKLTNVKG